MKPVREPVQTYNRPAVMVGLAVTLAMLAAQYLGWLEPLERQSLDLRTTYAWIRPRPMSDQICHVDIDDGAIQSVGRWPWHRSALADVAHELRAAGARTIAWDLILSDPEEPQMVLADLAGPTSGSIPGSADHDESGGESVYVPLDHDALFAESLEIPAGQIDGRSILSARPTQGKELHEQWRLGTGPAEFDRLMRVLGENIQIDPDEATIMAGLRGLRLVLFKRNDLTFKSIAAWHRVRELASAPERDHPLTREEFFHAVTPRASEVQGDFPERKLLEQAWDQHLAWTSLRASLLKVSSSSRSFAEAPLPRFAQRASAVGFVPRNEHPDGVVREIPPVWEVPGGGAVQLGVLAATLQLGLSASDISIDGDRLRVGERSIPLREGNIWITWPRPINRAHGAFGLIRQDATQPDTAGHFSIATLVGLAEMRRDQRRHERVYAELTHQYSGGEGPPPTYDEMDRAAIATVREFVEFALAPPADDEPDEPLSAEEEDELRWMKSWRELDKQIPMGREAIADAALQIRTLVEGRLVMVGWTSTAAVADFLPTPIDPLTPGDVVHAAIANMVLSGWSLRFAPAWSSFALIAAMGIGCTLVAARLSPARSTMVALTALLIYALVISFGLHGGLSVAVAMVGPMMSGAGAWVGCTVIEAVLFQRDRMRITRQFKARVSGQLVDYLVDNPESVTMTGEQREMTVMFADLAGFTHIAETLGGQRTVATLNRYLSAMTTLLIEEGAYLNKFLGDGFMAFWSAFAIDPHQATRACIAALHCQKAVERLNDDPDYRDIPRLSLRVGISTGRVVVGDCGAPPQLNDYTVIGDAVNLAARLESANKQFGTRILVDARTREQLSDATVLLRPIGCVAVVGQKQSYDLYEILPEDTPGGLIDMTAKAVEAFKGGDLERSAEAWREMHERFPGDKLSKFYLGAIAAVDSDFDGVLRLQEK